MHPASAGKGAVESLKSRGVTIRLVELGSDGPRNLEAALQGVDIVISDAGGSFRANGHLRMPQRRLASSALCPVILGLLVCEVFGAALDARGLYPDFQPRDSRSSRLSFMLNEGPADYY